MDPYAQRGGRGSSRWRRTRFTPWCHRHPRWQARAVRDAPAREGGIGADLREREWFTSTSKCLRKHGRVPGLAKMAESGWRWGRAIACVVVQPASLTEYTGGSRVAALNHVRPASAEPNTSPDVAPK